MRPPPFGGPGPAWSGNNIPGGLPDGSLIADPRVMATAGTPMPDRRLRWRRTAERRQRASAAVQQEVFVRLLAGGVGFFVLFLVGVYLVLSVAGPRTARGVLPVLDAYMKAGLEQDVRNGHRLFARQALRTVRPADVAAQFADRTLFEGYRGLEITSVKFSSLARRGPTDAALQARILYQGQPPGRLTARLLLESGRWRLVSVELRHARP